MWSGGRKSWGGLCSFSRVLGLQEGGGDVRTSRSRIGNMPWTWQREVHRPVQWVGHYSGKEEEFVMGSGRVKAHGACAASQNRHRGRFISLQKRTTLSKPPSKQK